MGKRIGADGRGRYEEKGGGQQVGSFFAEATEYEKINAIYGSTGLWNQLRYWWLDTENYTSFMLMDKSFYDYDYSEPKPRANSQPKPKSKEELNTMLSRFGFKTKLRTPDSKPLTPSELQAEVMREEEKKQQKR